MGRSAFADPGNEDGLAGSTLYSTDSTDMGEHNADWTAYKNVDREVSG